MVFGWEFRAWSFLVMVLVSFTALKFLKSSDRLTPFIACKTAFDLQFPCIEPCLWLVSSNMIDLSEMAGGIDAVLFFICCLPPIWGRDTSLRFPSYCREYMLFRPLGAGFSNGGCRVGFVVYRLCTRLFLKFVRLVSFEYLSAESLLRIFRDIFLFAPSIL